MPCYTPTDEELGITERKNKEIKSSQLYKEKVKEVRILSALLCSACRVLEDPETNFDFALNPELDRWWTKHKEEDRKRELAEAKERLENERILDLSKKPFGELTADDKKFLKKKGML